MGVRGTGVAIAIAGSAILHVALLGVLDAVDHSPPVRPLLALPRLTVEPRTARAADDPIPIELVVLAAPVEVAPATPPPPDLAAPPPPLATAPPVTAPARTPADGPVPLPTGFTSAESFVATTRIDPAATTVPGEPGEPTGPDEPGLLSMRGGPRSFRPILDPRRVGLTVAPPDPSKPPYQPPEPSGQLRPDGGGTFRTDQPGFIGHVGQGGAITFEDKPSATIKLHIPRPTRIARAAARGLESWYADPGAARRKGEANPDELPGVRATEEPVEDHSNPDAVIAPILSGSFDATDAVMRAAGMDPYFAAKLKWMDETRAERTELARRHRDRELAKSTQNMRRHLARLWQRPGLDAAARREALFELWDDCVEQGEAALLDACTRTRAEVIGFIRARLPAGSPAAYTADELRALNARRASSIPFAP